ncbi:LysR family transcriptional regulator [Burkholderia sp. WAC0059]|uniref:LysR substrate-binding domain-containing protein n=1 Tax=Burkholderia sp. WAC0059 TaxID=2066022 RepID=UPI000C7F0753|nr:LysR substrate-binding domain-containing protein [Burkholderia sp. WAC0059]PLZ02368.1 LysR family transcriptional regulator [Burkholderia sp. WAC0059]
MEIAWLEDFLALSRSLNFSRTAEIRNLTQPALSRRIRQLESWLGVTLIDRSSHPASLTDEGRSFRRVAEEVLRNLHEERDYYQGRILTRRKPFVSFAMVHTLAFSFYPDWIGEMERHIGELRTQVVCSSTHGCMQALTSGTIDFFLSYLHPAWPLALDEQQYPSLRIDTEKLVPVCAPDERGRPRYDLDEAGDEAIPYLECGPNTITAKMVEVVLKSRDPRPILETRYRNTISAALKAMAVKGYGVTWLPGCAVVDELRDGRLVSAGSEDWSLPMELRIYRSRRYVGGSSDKERLWEQCRAQYA